MIKCIVCGNDFTYDSEVGYSDDPPICGPYCDGRRSSTKTIDALADALHKTLWLGFWGHEPPGETEQVEAVVDSIHAALKLAGRPFPSIETNT